MIDMIWFGWWAVFISLNSVSSNNSSEANTPLLSSTIKIVPFSISFLLSEAKGICFWLFLQMRRPIIGRFLLFSVMLLFIITVTWHWNVSSVRVVSVPISSLVRSGFIVFIIWTLYRLKFGQLIYVLFCNWLIINVLIFLAYRLLPILCLN